MVLCKYLESYQLYHTNGGNQNSALFWKCFATMKVANLPFSVRIEIMEIPLSTVWMKDTVFFTYIKPALKIIIKLSRLENRNVACFKNISKLIEFLLMVWGLCFIFSLFYVFFMYWKSSFKISIMDTHGE